MSAVYGIAGFVDGFIGGRDTKNRWEDRKLDRKRQDKLDAMGESEHTRRMKIMDLQIGATEKAAADEAEMAKIYADSVGAANAAMGAEPSVTPSTSGGAASASGQPSVSLPLGLPPRDPNASDPALDKILADQAAQKAMLPLPLNQPGRSAVPPPASLVKALEAQNAPVPVGPRRAEVPLQGPGFEDVGRGGQPNMPVGPEFERTGRGGLPPMGPDFERTGRGLPPVAPARATDQLAQVFKQSTTPRPGPGPVFEQSGRSNPGSISDAAAAAAAMNEMTPEGRKRAEAGDTRAAALEVEGLRRLAYEDGPIPLESRRVAAAKLKDMGYITEDGGKTLRKSVDFPKPPTGPRVGMKPPAGTPTAPVPASAPPAVRGLAQTATTAMAETATPAMQEASASAAKGLPAPPKGGAKTEAARTKYAKGFMDHYIEKGAPMVVEAFLKKGQFDKAQKFMEFMQSTETKAGMDDWAKAAFAASVGDMDGFSDHILSAYNRLDYFGDATTIVKEKSGFTKDRSGNITGAKITFRDETTGNEFDQVFADPNDLVRMGITLLAPEQAFEYFYQQQQAAAEASRGLSPREQAKEDKAAEADLQKRVDGVAKTILEAANDPLNPRTGPDGEQLPPMTYAEARQEAEATLRGESGPTVDGPGMPPVVYRPAGQ